jgi:hypothetical protein
MNVVYDNNTRTHLAMAKDARVSRCIQHLDRTTAQPLPGRMHPEYD